MVTGMSVGSKRRVMIPAFSATKREDTLQFDIQLKSIPTGREVITFRATRALPGLIRTAILLSFLPDILSFLGILPQAALTFQQPGFGAVDLLSKPSDAHVMAQAAAGPMVDAANLWAAQGLQGLF
mmetsp:Transcript_46058/g.120652  ORF Transcript_46058/g.120652 Transcript_46058/m.120652 type:complete len:126 (-) Transcript_46058:565-942(-)